MTPRLRASIIYPGALLLAALFACDDEAPLAGDGGLRDQEAARDLPAEVDGPVPGPDLPRSDTAPLPPPACDPALDLAPLELAPTYCVVQRLKLAGLTESFGLRGLSAFTLEAPDQEATWRVLRWPLDPAPGQAPSPSAFFSFTPQLPDGATKLHPGRYLSISPGGLIAVGYTSDLIEGAVYWGGQGAEPRHVTSLGNYNVVLLDQDTLLVNGLGLGGVDEYQGVYVSQQGQPPRKLIDQIGSLSGHLALGDNALFAGGFMGDTNEVYGFSLGQINAAISSGATLTPADGTLTYFGHLRDMAAAGDDLVVVEADAYQDFATLTRYLVTVTGDTVAPVDAEILISNSARAVDRVAADRGQISIIWREGLDTALAVIKRKE